jgi:AhpD family alkylhydroperoxidase
MPTSPSEDASQRRRIEPAPPATTPEARAAEQQILASRGRITALYQVLLNSPVVAKGWEALLTAIRQQMALDPAIRELIILRVAVLNQAAYEYEAHAPIARAAGLSEAKLEAVKAMDPGLPKSAPFNEVERAVLDYTDALTREVRVDDALFERVRPHFDPAGLVEVTATIAAYNMVSRFLIALDVH